MFNEKMIAAKAKPLEHGGAMRMVIPTLYAWKSGKFLRGLEFAAGDKPGFWEQSRRSMA